MGEQGKMAGGSTSSGRSLEQTPTWAVAVVCFVLVLVSIFIEQIIHFIGKVSAISCELHGFRPGFHVQVA